MINFKKMMEAETISLTEIGWTESREDNQIKKYVKSFIKKNYEKEIDDDLALIFVLIIDDLLSDFRKKESEEK